MNNELKEKVEKTGLTGADFKTAKFDVKKLDKYYALYDKTSKTFLQLTKHGNNAVALRSLDALVNSREENMVKKYPDDYSMYLIGYLNEETGEFTQEKTKIGEAAEYVKNEQTN